MPLRFTCGQKGGDGGGLSRQGRQHRQKQGRVTVHSGTREWSGPLGHGRGRGSHEAEEKGLAQSEKSWLRSLHFVLECHAHPQPSTPILGLTPTRPN